MEQVKQHFDAEAKIYDETIIRLVPNYHEIIRALADGIAFGIDANFAVLDIGCGTGTISRSIADKFPQATFTLLDIAPNMIEIAKHKMSNRPGTEFVLSDFTHYGFPAGRFDVVVSSLALHHAETDNDKINLYRRIFKSLRSGGQFLNADVMIAPTEHGNKLYLDRWIEFMRKSVSEDEIRNKWLVTYDEEDRPTTIANHLKWLEEVGFECVDVLWKYFTGAVYGGVKPWIKAPF